MTSLALNLFLCLFSWAHRVKKKRCPKNVAKVKSNLHSKPDCPTGDRISKSEKSWNQEIIRLELIAPRDLNDRLTDLLSICLLNQMKNVARLVVDPFHSFGFYVVFLCRFPMQHVQWNRINCTRSISTFLTFSVDKLKLRCPSLVDACGSERVNAVPYKETGN